MRTDVARWLTDERWTHWATLTCRSTPTPRSLRPRVERYLARIDARAYWCIERGTIGGRAHAHALLEIDPARDAFGAWEHGRRAVEEYDAAKGAAWYVAKYVTKAPNDWDYRCPMLTLFDARSRVAHPRSRNERLQIMESDRRSPSCTRSLTL